MVEFRPERRRYSFKSNLAQIPIAQRKSTGDKPEDDGSTPSGKYHRSLSAWSKSATVRLDMLEFGSQPIIFVESWCKGGILDVKPAGGDSISSGSFWYLIWST